MKTSKGEVISKKLEKFFLEVELFIESARKIKATVKIIKTGNRPRIFVTDSDKRCDNVGAAPVAIPPFLM
jgi:hypothetical protein